MKNLFCSGNGQQTPLYVWTQKKRPFNSALYVFVLLCLCWPKSAVGRSDSDAEGKNDSQLIPTMFLGTSENDRTAYYSVFEFRSCCCLNTINSSNTLKSSLFCLDSFTCFSLFHNGSSSDIPSKKSDVTLYNLHI